MEVITEPLDLQKQLMTRIVLFVLPFAIVAFVFGQWSTGLGLLLGGLGGIVHLRLLVIDVHRLTRLTNPAAAGKAAKRGYFKRYALLGLFLVVPFFNPMFNFAATVVGLLSVKVAIYLGELITYIKGNNRHARGEQND